MSAIELVSDGTELTLFKLGHPDTAPAFGGTNESGVHQLQGGTLTKGMGNDLAASAFLARQPLDAPIIAHGVNNSTALLPLTEGPAAQRAYIRQTLKWIEKSTGIRGIG